MTRKFSLSPYQKRFIIAERQKILTIYEPEIAIEVGEGEDIPESIQKGLEAGILVEIQCALDAGISEEESSEDPTAVASMKPGSKRPTQDKKCSGKTKTGNNCGNRALVGSLFCVKHIDEEDLAEIDRQLIMEEQTECTE